MSERPPHFDVALRVPAPPTARHVQITALRRFRAGIYRALRSRVEGPARFGRNR